MNRRKTLGPNDLVQKIDAEKAWWEQCVQAQNDVAASRSSYDNTIHAGLTCICEGAGTEELKLRVIEALPDYFAFRIRNGTNIETSHEDEILKMLLVDKLLESYMQHPDAERNLAWFCVQRAQGFQQFNLTDYEELLSKFLMEWLKVKTPSPFKNKTIEIAGLVYGGHVNALSIWGYSDSTELPSELWSANQPVYKPAAQNKSTTEELVMPNDISL